MKTCIVFGVGPGVGLSLIKKYHSEGFKTIAISRNKNKLRELLDSNGLKETATFSIDAIDARAVENVMTEITSQTTDIDTFIYNAAAIDSLGGQGQFHEIGMKKLNQDFQASVGSAFLAAQIVLKQMTSRGNGTVLFTGGGLALYPNPSWGTLSMGKSGIRTLAQLLHAELKPQGIVCGTVMIAGMVGSSEKFSADNIANTFFNFQSLSKGEFEVQYR